MKCLYPFIAPGRLVFPCGQCMPCRYNRRRIWTHRIMLERELHASSCFVTLTYRDAPAGNNLNPEDLRNWIKRFRARLYPQPIRYYVVGEYGEQTGRPHYHGAIFGVGPCGGGISKVTSEGRECQCQFCLNVKSTWGFGHVMVGSLEQRSAQYIAGYVVKKMGTSIAQDGLVRVPEFARMSLRPGIGARAVPDIASVIARYKLMEKLPDVPVALRHGGKVWPLGRYLRRALRLEIGLPEGAPETYVEALRSGLLPVFEAADALLPSRSSAKFKNAIVAAAIGAENEQAARNLNARSIIKKGTL